MLESVHILYLVLLFLCLVASAFFSSAETAFVSLPKTRVMHMVSTKVAGAERVARMTEQPERLLATVLLCNNFVNVAAAALGTVVAVSIWEGDIGVLIATIVVTILLLIFAEVTPKTFAIRHAERLALLYVYPLGAITTIAYPIAAGLGWLGSTLAGGRVQPKSVVSEDEIRSMISVGREEGTVEEAEAEMLHKVFDFGDCTVREVTTPRPEVTWIEEGTKLADFLATYAESPHTRFPVYRDNIDNVTGILSIKDVLMAQAKGSLDKGSTIDELVRPVYFVPEAKRIAQLFAEMQSHGYQMVVVVDEFGVTSGIVTMEQLVGEIVGRLGDELMSEVKDFEFIDELTIQIDGSMRVEDANEELGLGLPQGDYDTVAGFVLSLLGFIPKEGEQLRYNGLKLVILEMRGLKIEKVLVTKE
ncbi:MAG: HlyC/CorC family transporter [Dehalococcoidia bacterium]|nr:HlyC/CorC family transporter [Dehalococcoidia bacterium]